MIYISIELSNFFRCAWPLNNTNLNSAGPLIQRFFFPIHMYSSITWFMVGWSHGYGGLTVELYIFLTTEWVSTLNSHIIQGQLYCFHEFVESSVFSYNFLKLLKTIILNFHQVICRYLLLWGPLLENYFAPLTGSSFFIFLGSLKSYFFVSQRRYLYSFIAHIVQDQQPQQKPVNKETPSPIRILARDYEALADIFYRCIDPTPLFPLRGKFLRLYVFSQSCKTWWGTESLLLLFPRAVPWNILFSMSSLNPVESTGSFSSHLQRLTLAICGRYAWEASPSGNEMFEALKCPWSSSMQAQYPKGFVGNFPDQVHESSIISSGSFLCSKPLYLNLHLSTLFAASLKYLTVLTPSIFWVSILWVFWVRWEKSEPLGLLLHSWGKWALVHYILTFPCGRSHKLRWSVLALNCAAPGEG